jgi:PKD repeat protein
VDPATGTAPLFVKYDASGSYSSGGTITTYIWDFGDGTHGTGITGIHSYSNPGTYTIRLTVTDNSGLSGTVSRQVQINAPAVITTQQTLSHDQVIAHIGR